MEYWETPSCLYMSMITQLIAGVTVVEIDCRYLSYKIESKYAESL